MHSSHMAFCLLCQKDAAISPTMMMHLHIVSWTVYVRNSIKFATPDGARSHLINPFPTRSHLSIYLSVRECMYVCEYFRLV